MTKGRDSSDVPSVRRLLLFYLPLVVLALSQQLTYPLVGSIVSHGPLGEQEFTAYAVGQQVLFLIGAVGAGLITTGMMFCRSNVGLRNFLRMNLVIAGVSAALQLCTCLPGIDRLVFGRALGLDGEMLRIARDSLLWCIPLQTIFFLRNPYLAALFNAKRSGLTNYATLLRVVMALSFASVFPLLGWTGWGWGVFATTLPALLETLLTWWLARPFLRGAAVIAPRRRAGILRAAAFLHDPAFGKRASDPRLNHRDCRISRRDARSGAVPSRTLPCDRNCEPALHIGAADADADRGVPSRTPRGPETNRWIWRGRRFGARLHPAHRVRAVCRFAVVFLHRPEPSGDKSGHGTVGNGVRGALPVDLRHARVCRGLRGGPLPHGCRDGRSDRLLSHAACRAFPFPLRPPGSGIPVGAGGYGGCGTFRSNRNPRPCQAREIPKLTFAIRWQW